jgi:hypothetical protein
MEKGDLKVVGGRAMTEGEQLAQAQIDKARRAQLCAEAVKATQVKWECRINPILSHSAMGPGADFEVVPRVEGMLIGSNDGGSRANNCMIEIKRACEATHCGIVPHITYMIVPLDGPVPGMEGEPQ